MYASNFRRCLGSTSRITVGLSRSSSARALDGQEGLRQAYTHNIYTHTPRDAATPAEPAARGPRHPDVPDRPELGVVMQRMGIVSGREGGRLDTRS